MSSNSLQSAAFAFAALLSCQTASAADVAPATARYTLEGPPGPVEVLTIAPKDGGKIVADGFLDDPDLASTEHEILADQDMASGTCAMADAARPFTRLRRFDEAGTLRSEWRIEPQEAVTLMAPGGGGDCLSPDGRHLTVEIYSVDPFSQTGNRLGGAVIAVGAVPGFEVATGRRTKTNFGHPRYSGLIGWRAGEPATLDFEIYDTDWETHPDPVPDEAVMTPLTAPDRR